MDYKSVFFYGFGFYYLINRKFKVTRSSIDFHLIPEQRVNLISLRYPVMVISAGKFLIEGLQKFPH